MSIADAMGIADAMAAFIALFIVGFSMAVITQIIADRRADR